MKRPEYNKNYGTWFLNDVHRAIKRYTMIYDNETVFVGLSGGKDSMVLLWILSYLSRFSHLHFTLHAAHVRTAEYSTAVLHDFCEALQVPYHEVTLQSNSVASEKLSCSLCSRLKRGALSRLLHQQDASCLAYGHHADDAAQTLLMNMIYNRKLGSFSPVVRYADNPLRVVRPMIYLSEKTISQLHAYWQLPVLQWKCPHDDTTSRSTAAQALTQLGRQFGVADVSQRLVHSLEHLDTTNVWSDNAQPEND